MRSAVIKIEGLPEIERALRPEMEEDVPRSSVRTSHSRGMFRIEIDADDTAALQAALSSRLRWISAAYQTKKAMEE